MVASTDRILLTADQYFAWEQTQTERYEFWDGEVVAMSGSSRKHNRVSLNFSKLLDNALGDRQCEVYMVDVKVQVQPHQKYFYPDVVVTCDQRDRTETLLVMFPCLIIEVLSPSTEAYDRGIKFAQYRKLESLQEYVLVQVDQPVVEVFQRHQTNKGEQWLFSEYELGDLLHLKSIEVEIAIADIFKQLEFGSPNPNSPAT